MKGDALSKKSKNKTKNAPQTSPIRREIWGIILLLIVVVLGVSFFSHHPADAVIGVKTGGGGKPFNLFGAVGANLSGWIFYIFGFAAFWIIAIFLPTAILSFTGKQSFSPLKSILATLFVVGSFSGLLGLKWPGFVAYHGEDVRMGGEVGHYLSNFMKPFLNEFGAYVLLLAIFIICIIVCTRISLGLVFTKIMLLFLALLKRLREHFLKRKEKRRKKKVRAKIIQKEKIRPKTQITILEPEKEKKKKPEQEAFPFMNVAGKFKLPPIDLLNDPPEDAGGQVQRESLEMNARRLEKKLADFGVEGEVVEILPGPVITMYELRPAPGVKISKVAGLSDDLALALRATSVRIVAPIPGKAAIGIEIANNRREPVFLKEILSSQDFKQSKYNLTIGLGKDITGMPFITDLSRMPHLLVAGATGTGKSVSLNAMINSILFKASPDMIRFLMIDPKRIELSIYKDIPHLLHPVVTEPKEATRALRWAVREMERRYMLLSDRGVRNIDAYNRKITKSPPVKGGNIPEEGQETNLPYIILVIDELADLMMISSREVEEAITRLAQMARAAGIHLIIATQRPSVDVLTGIIKANFPTRISFQVSSKVDSRTILDTIGAEHLLGEGDMLFMPPGVSRLTRIHGAYISEDEVKNVTDFLRKQMTPDYDESVLSEVAQDEEMDNDDFEKDEKYDQAVELVIQSRQASISMLQRKLRVGYNRAARMIETMEREGIVGPSDGVRPREVFGRGEES